MIVGIKFTKVGGVTKRLFEHSCQIKLDVYVLST